MLEVAPVCVHGETEGARFLNWVIRRLSKPLLRKIRRVPFPSPLIPRPDVDEAAAPDPQHAEHFHQRFPAGK